MDRIDIGWARKPNRGMPPIKFVQKKIKAKREFSIKTGTGEIARFAMGDVGTLTFRSEEEFAGLLAFNNFVEIKDTDVDTDKIKSAVSVLPLDVMRDGGNVVQQITGNKPDYHDSIERVNENDSPANEKNNNKKEQTFDCIDREDSAKVMNNKIGTDAITFCNKCGTIMLVETDGSSYCPMCKISQGDKNKSKAISLCPVCNKRKAADSQYCKDCEMASQKITGNTDNLD